MPDENAFPEGVLMLLRDGKDRNVKAETHALADTGCNRPIIAEKAAEEMNLVTYDNRVTRIRTAGNDIIVSRKRVIVELEHRQKGKHVLRFIAVVVPNFDFWKTTVPYSKPPWLCDISHLLADPIIADRETEYINYSILMGRACMNQLRMTIAWYDDNCFSMQSSTAGYIPSGVWTDESPVQCPAELCRKINMLDDYFDSMLANPEEDDEEEFYDHPLSMSSLLNTSPSPEDEDMSREIREQREKEIFELFGDDAETAESKNRETFDSFLKLLRRGPDGRVIAPLPKKAGAYPDLVCENMQTGKRRIKRVEKMLEANDKYAHAYTAFIQNWIDTGVLKKTTLEELRRHGKWTELPHHGVIRVSKTTPVRPVIEGNAHDPGKHSTNEVLDVGVNVLPMINEIVTNLRIKKHFIMSDISRAFVQVQLMPEDQWLLVIRWPRRQLEDGTWEYDFYRFMHLPWGICCAPFILNATVRYLFRKYAELHPELVYITLELEKNAYVDDIASTGDTPKETIEAAKIAVEALAAGQMELTKHRGFPSDIVTALGSEPTNEPYKLLGCGYDPTDDTMFITLDNLEDFRDKTRISKRQAAGIVARIFDPLGWATPVSLEAKKLRQKLDLAHPKAEWNYMLTPEETKDWHELVKATIKLRQFKISRRLTIDDETKREYHVFTDASGTAIGAVIYCVSTNHEGQSKITLVTGKSKINPLPKQKKSKKKAPRELQIASGGVVEFTQQSPLQVNRMELNAALLGARLLESIKMRLGEKPKVHFWTDSQVTLQWLYKGPYTGVNFVDTRIKKILATCDASQWKHCSTTDNPADLASRGCKAEELLQSELWKNGPNWLTKPELWPQHNIEVRACVTNTDQADITSVRDTFTRMFFEKRHKLDHISRPDHKWINCVKRYAAFQRLQNKMLQNCTASLQTPSYCLRSKRRKKEKPPDYFRKGNPNLFTKGELAEAEIGLLREMQRLFAPRIWQHLKNNPDDIIDGLTWSKGPVSDLQLIVSCGRQVNMMQPTGSAVEKSLIYIPQTNGSLDKPKLNPVAKMLMVQAHQSAGHGAAIPTLADFRHRFWVSKGRKLAVWARKNCPICVKHDSKVMHAPPGKLPDYRYTGNAMFKTIGIDFVGPFRNLQKTKKKTWLCVFSCPLTRAVILRAVDDVSARTFASTLNEVIAEYNLDPDLIVSDRAATFKCVYRSTIEESAELLKREFKHVKWQFNASRAPWWGGFFERMMAIIKDKMARCFNNNSWHDMPALRAATAYAQRIVNSRPLTWISAAQEDACHAVTPLMYLTPHSKWNYLCPYDPYQYGPNEPRFLSLTPAAAKQDYVYLKNLYKTMWVHFFDSYVSELRKMRASKAQANDSLLREGQIVLFKPVSIGFGKKAFGSKSKWRLARIHKLHPSKNDGRVRAVDLSFADPKTGMISILESQSIENIAPLELDLTAAVDLSLKNLKKTKRETTPKPAVEEEIVQMNSQWLSLSA